MNRTFKLVLVSVLAVTLQACGGGGGGGGGGNNSNANPPPANPPASTDPLGPVGTTAEEQVRLIEAVGEEVLAVLYIDFDTAAEALQSAAASYCADPASGDFAALQSSWRQAMNAWQQAQFLRVGPVDEEARLERIQFFPDRSRVVGPTVDDLLAANTPITEASIAIAPVQAQGLPALEYLLFVIGGLDDVTDGPRRCDLATAIADNLATMAGDLAEAWGPGGTFIVEFTTGTGDSFDDVEDVLIAILETIAVQAEQIGDRKLQDAFLAGDVEQLESFRSENSNSNVDNNIEALQKLFDDDDDDTYRVRDYLERAHMAEPITA
ncbi:MAG: imelysin family protein, partial [Pseudomonadota bacterium]